MSVCSSILTIIESSPAFWHSEFIFNSIRFVFVRTRSYRGRIEVYFGSKVAPPASPFAAVPDVVIEAVNVR